MMSGPPPGSEASPSGSDLEWNQSMFEVNFSETIQSVYVKHTMLR